MWDINKILFPLDLDFKEGNTKMVRYLKAIAERNQAEIHLLHVLPDPTEYYGFYAVNMNFSELSQSMHETALKKIQAFVDESSLSNMNVQIHVVSGRPTDEIINFAENRGMDVIMMGTHGRRGLEETFFGSVVRSVIKLSPVPVLTVNPLRH
ncbi:universal stress protein [Dethiosulfatarculus sandiegensis]|uniref:Universal stress protein n=1 Tax=Dethiosulfatarculus sandiegensis TaxID=1429043 RepID=A0A0D2JX73_9BACT|nr:universal stress protein [Dethiosulfatarculus sandiegensis]KIX14190.1 universal stress protein [Dethiosulfatarculus sandiegensis]